MPKDEKRLNINGLLPGEKYAIQVRAVDDGEGSTWSQKYHIETIDDTAGGTRLPQPPVLTTWEVDASGQYVATFPSVNANTDGSPTVVKRYELELSGNGITAITPHYGQTGPTQTRSFNFGHIRGMFAGTIPTTITARLRVINSADTVSEWSEPKTASLPVPNPPENPKGIGAVDAVKVTWDPPSDPIHLWGYRVYLSMADPDFVPDTMGKSNLVYQGQAREFTYTSLSYQMDHHFKIVSISEPGLESTWVTPPPPPPRPISPYGPDLIAPLKPTLSFGTPPLDRSVLTAPKANLAWSVVEEAAENQDISGFVIRWRIVGDTHWRNSYFDKTARTGVIDLPRPFTNYEFQISAYDFVANYSEYAVSPDAVGPLVLEGAALPPAQVTGVDSVPRWDGLRIVWDESTSEAVKYTGGRYEVQLRNTNDFPSNTPVEYVTANNFVDVAGLPALSTWYYRVRAIDSANQVGPWSVVDSVTLPAFPVASASDGEAPSNAPTSLTAVGGLNYANIAWDRVTNNDAVFYEVYVDDTPGVTAIEANFAGESSGTSLMVTSLPDGSPLAQETNYYFKVRAVDPDGAGPLSSEVSTTLTQVLSTDLGINMSGENLYFNSSFDVDSDGNGVADYWTVYNSSSATEPVTPSLVAGRDGFGKAQRIQWTGTNTSTKGVYGGGTKILRPNTEYVLSFYARGNGGTGFEIYNNSGFAQTNKVWLERTAVSTTYQRYIVRFTTPAETENHNVFISVTGHSVAGTSESPAWIEIDDIQIEAGNIASAYKAGTVSFGKLTSGRMSTAELIIESAGIVKSTDYNPATRNGWAIHAGGIDVFKGQVDASTLVADTSITSNLYVGALLEVSSGGAIRSANYSNGSSTPAAGFRIDSVGIDIRTGTVAAGTFSAGTITSPDIRIGTNGKITVDSTGSIQSNNYSSGTTGWKISNLGIEMWDANSKINVNALETSTLTTTTITLGSGGYMQSNTWASGSGARWQLSENAFTMVNGTITGSTIITDQIYSAQSETVGGVTRRKFSINSLGYAEVSGIYIYGNAVVGNNVNNIIQSATYNGNGTGWRIDGTGNAWFFNLNTYNMNIYWAATVGGGSGNYVKSSSFEYGSAGWIIRGDGYAEFNSGMMRLGSAAGGVTALLSDGAGNGQLRFHPPGDTANFHHIRSAGQVLHIRGAYGGAIEMYPAAHWWTGSSLVRLIQDVDVTQRLFVGNNITVYNGGIWVQNGGIGITNGGLEMGGNLKLNSYADGSGGVRRLDIQDNGLVVLGGTSSRRYKDNIIPLGVRTESILALRAVEFDWNSETTQGRTGRGLGVIAEQAVELGLEKFVHYKMVGDEKVVDGFNYEGFTVALLMVAQDQQKQIDKLEKMIRRALDK